MFYLTYVIFLLVGHSGILAPTGADFWGAAWPRRGSHGVAGS
jgi:hypothetical protein